MSISLINLFKSTFLLFGLAAAGWNASSSELGDWVFGAWLAVTDGVAVALTSSSGLALASVFGFEAPPRASS